MFKKYSENIDYRLNEIVSIGWAHITWKELCCWYEVNNVTKEVWLDIQSRLSEIMQMPLADVGANILVIGVNENGFILAKSDCYHLLSIMIDKAAES